jgi:hypothetical protein
LEIPTKQLTLLLVNSQLLLLRVLFLLIFLFLNFHSNVFHSLVVVAARLRAAGAIILGKTNMHEIGIGPTGENFHFGHARNPYNTSYHTGGFLSLLSFFSSHFYLLCHFVFTLAFSRSFSLFSWTFVVYPL